VSVLDASNRDDILEVTYEENRVLVDEVAEEMVKRLCFIWNIIRLGPDDFLAEFYQTFWNLIKNDLMALFHEFHLGTLPLYSLNFGTIILLP
jgi:hypothetical protein